MPKRKNLYAPEFSCPSCEELFDSDTRSPFVGSCGHSLCAVCAKKKKTTCPVCDRRFAPKQKNDLAAVLLDALVKAHERLFPIVLKPENLPFLTPIINKLDPCSFVRFSRTCKPIYELCFKNQDVKVTFDIEIMGFFTDSLVRDSLRVHMEMLSDSVQLNYSGDEHGFLGSVENRKLLRNFPFVFKLGQLYLDCSITEQLLTQVRFFLAEFAITSFPIITDCEIVDWDAFAQFLKDFETGDVEIRHYPVRDVVAAPPRIPDEVASYLLQCSFRLLCDLRIHDSLILNASMLSLCLKNAAISKKTFLSLLEKLANSTRSFAWRIGRQPFEFGHYDVFESVEEGFNGPYPKTRPLAFVDKTNPHKPSFEVLRRDRKRLKCYIHKDSIVFTTFPIGSIHID